MRRITLFTACCIACAVLLVFLLPGQASALQATGIQKSGFHDDSFHLARRGGFRGGSVRVSRGGGRAYAFRGGGARAWRGGRAYAYRGGGARVWRGGGARAWRGGRAVAWRGGRRVWRGGRWVWLGAPALAAAPYYYGDCPVVRRRVWTPNGYRIRWVRRCYY